MWLESGALPLLLFQINLVNLNIYINPDHPTAQLTLSDFVIIVLNHSQISGSSLVSIVSILY